MTNYLKMPKKTQVLALLELGWSYRRIEAETGVRRETVSGYDAARQANPAKTFPGSSPRPRFAAARYRTAITEKLDAGLSVQRMSAMVEVTHSLFGRRAMLALTENVTEIVKKLAEEVPAISGLRIATEPDGQSLSVSPADQAAPEDQVVEQDGATVYVEETASVMLADMVLDGGVDEEGNIQFALGQQA